MRWGCTNKVERWGNSSFTTAQQVGFSDETEMGYTTIQFAANKNKSTAYFVK